MFHSTNKSGQSLIWLVCALALVALWGCGEVDDDKATDAFRAGIVSEADIALTYGDQDTRSSALNGEVSGLAALTAETVITTNLFLGRHLRMLRRVVQLPPSQADGDRRVWEGTHDSYLVRVVVERSEAPRGTRFDYSMSARPADDPSHAMLTIFDGHVVRVETRPGHNQGWGVARFFFDNVETLGLEDDVGGTARLAFRRVGQVRQVRVRLIEVQTKDDPDFPKAAAYDYVLLPDRSGRLKWFSRADFNRDGGEPLEKIVAHSYWRDDLSGAGFVRATGGTLDVDYVGIGECWSRRARKVYERFVWPDGPVEDGDVGACLADPEALELPEYREQLPDADPDIPSAHPQERD